jgi:hypothetical protein
MGRENASTSKPARLDPSASLRMALVRFDSHTLPPVHFQDLAEFGKMLRAEIRKRGIQFVGRRRPTRSGNRSPEGLQTRRLPPRKHWDGTARDQLDAVFSLVLYSRHIRKDIAAMPRNAA